MAGATNVQPPVVLVLAGHDPTGGAGIMADGEAIAACGGWALTVPTAKPRRTIPTAASMWDGSSQGWSPCTLTTTPAPPPRAA